MTNKDSKKLQKMKKNTIFSISEQAVQYLRLWRESLNHRDTNLQTNLLQISMKILEKTSEEWTDEYNYSKKYSFKGLFIFFVLKLSIFLKFYVEDFVDRSSEMKTFWQKWTSTENS